MAEATFSLVRGRRPLLLSIPHAGTWLPADLGARLTPAARAQPDADRHLDRLYEFAAALEVSIITMHASRYVIDVNRPPDGSNLYPGRNSTRLCPIDTFAHEPLYAAGDEPDVDEIGQRLAHYWRPYHAALAEELERLRARHAAVFLWDAHSIRSREPRFFEGRLPDLNFGSADGQSATAALVDRVTAVADAGPYSWILDGRFTGGYITRHYGRPERGVHALQLELAQSTYMDEAAPYAYRTDEADALIPWLGRFLEAALSAVEA